MEDNILGRGIDGLKELRYKLIQSDRYQNENSQYKGEVKKLDKAIINKEKAIEDELDFTIKKRREEIESTYNQEIAKLKDEIKKIQNKKEKSKNVQVSERIKLETADLSEEYKKMDMEIKQIMKENKSPSFVNTSIFYALYMPKGIKEGIIAIIALLLMLLVIPCGIYFFILPGQKVLYLIITYILTIVLFGGTYILIGSKVKDKYLPMIKEIRVIRTNILKNKTERNKIRKQILKDDDESIYALERYDEKIDKINKDIEGIEGRKKTATEDFRRETIPIITAEIRGHHSEDLLNMNSELKNLNQKTKENDDNIRNLTRDLVENYEAFLGKEFMFVGKIDQVISIMEENDLEKISDGLSQYRKAN